MHFFPPEPVVDVSGSSTSTIAVKFTYRQRWEDVVQAFWDLTQPDWERTGHSLGLASNRLATPPSGTSCHAGLRLSKVWRQRRRS